MLSKTLEECQEKLIQVIASHCCNNDVSQLNQEIHDGLSRAYHLGSQDLLKAIALSLDTRAERH